MSEYASEFDRYQAQKDAIVAKQNAKILQPAKDLIDKLALALTDHDHQWSPELRKEYETVMGAK